MSRQSMFLSSGRIDSKRLITFFEVVSVLGGMLWLGRVLVIATLTGTVLFLMK